MYMVALESDLVSTGTCLQCHNIIIITITRAYLTYCWLVGLTVTEDHRMKVMVMKLRPQTAQYTT